VADGRIDLLAEEAGFAIGFHDQDTDSPVYLQIAQLCIKAGAAPAQAQTACRHSPPGVIGSARPSMAAGWLRRELSMCTVLGCWQSAIASPMRSEAWPRQLILA
jgi:hypothetical protein